MKTNFNFSYTAIKAPCKDCPNRKVGCRESCIPWQEYQALKDEEEAKKKLKYFGFVFK